MKIRLFTKLNQILIDALLCAAAWCAAYWFAYGLGVLPVVTPVLLLVVLLAGAGVVCGALFGIYKFRWRYVSTHDALRIVESCLAYAAIVGSTAALAGLAIPELRIPLRVIGTMFVLWSGGEIGARLARRALYEHEHRSESAIHHETERFLIVGAGQQGARVAQEIAARKNVRVVGFLDDDPEKAGAVIAGLPVLGRLEDLRTIVKTCAVDEILICISPKSRPHLNLADVMTSKGMPVRNRIMPTLDEILQSNSATPSLSGANGLHRWNAKNGTAEHKGTKAHAADRAPCPTVTAGNHRNGNGRSDSLSAAARAHIPASGSRTFRLEDLLGREPVHVEATRIHEDLRGKVVLITGAAGSIGSELVRQVARFEPRKIVLVDRSENDLFKMGLELPQACPGLDIESHVADILDVATLREIFGLHRPSSVFHAAAYKHVPMMERNCFQAVSNNVFGTYNVALLARQFGVDKFVMISSDKAVKPSNIMGVTKRVAELIVLSLQRETTKYVSVRFGNVLGSNGSVVPIFEQQITAGGPVTVTHPETRRYFMTISEAVELVLQASIMGRGGEIFVLDMGEPVKIVDLARQLIWLSGLEPEKDIQIVFTGLRPGEKLFEELRFEGEGMKTTTHPKIRMLEGEPVLFGLVHGWLEELTAHAEAKNVAGLVECLKKIVPEYTPSDEIRALCEIDCHDLGLKYAQARSTLADPMQTAPSFSHAAGIG